MILVYGIVEPCGSLEGLSLLQQSYLCPILPQFSVWFCLGAPRWWNSHHFRLQEWRSLANDFYWHPRQTHKNRWVRVGLLTDVAWHLEGLGRKASRLWMMMMMMMMHVLHDTLMLWECFYCFVQTWQWQHPHNMEFPGILKRPQGVDGQKIGRMEDVEIAFRYWQKMKCGKFGYTLFYGNPPPARIYRVFFPYF